MKLLSSSYQTLQYGVHDLISLGFMELRDIIYDKTSLALKTDDHRE